MTNVHVPQQASLLVDTGSLKQIQKMQVLMNMYPSKQSLLGDTGSLK